MRTLSVLLALAVVCAGAETKLGRPLTLKKPIAIQELTSNAGRYVDKTVQVKGKITSVCQNMGCWMMIADDAGNAIRIKVKDGEIAFPKDSAGKAAIAEGTFAKIEMTKEQALAQAKHEAEENGKSFDPKSVTGPQTTYQIQGSGAVIID